MDKEINESKKAELLNDFTENDIKIRDIDDL